MGNLFKRIGLSLAFCIWLVVAFMAVQLFVNLVVSFVIDAGYRDLLGNTVVSLTIFSVFIYAATIVVAIAVPYKLFKDKTTLKELGADKKVPTWLDIGLAPVAYVTSLVAIAVVMLVVKNFVPGFDMEQRQALSFNPSSVSNHVELMMVYFTLAVLAPVAEEVMFRGYLFGKIKRYLPLPATVLVTAFVFSVLHLGLGSLADLQWNVAVATFVLGVALGWLRAATGGLWAGIVLHMMQNTIAFLILFATPFAFNM